MSSEEDEKRPTNQISYDQEFSLNKSFSLLHLITSIENNFQPDLSSENISLVYKFCKDFPKKIIYEKDYLEEIIKNLISNSMKSCSNGGIIELNFEYFPNHKIEFPHMKFFIKDTGKGMPPKLVHNIYQEYFSSLKGENYPHEGIGDGFLSIIDGLKHLKGNLKIDSKEGEGTTVRIDFPHVMVSSLVGDEISIEEVDPEEASQFKGKKVLIVGDVGVNRLLIKSCLAPYGPFLFFCDNGGEILPICKESDIDLILLDFNLPSVDLNEVIKNLKRVSKIKANLLIMTSSSILEETSKLSQEGALIINKPIKRRHLIEKILEIFSK